MICGPGRSNMDTADGIDGYSSTGARDGHSTFPELKSDLFE